MSVQIRAQDYYVGGGIKFNYSPHVYGWQQKPFNTSFYYNTFRDPPDMDNFFLGLFAEFSKHKHLATVIDLDYRIRSYKFNVTDYAGQQSSLNGEVNMLTLALSEKLKYGVGKFSFYGFGGLRGDLYIIKSGFVDFLRQYADLNSLIPGINLGAGISFGKKHRVSFDIHFDFDLRNHYKSSTGNIKYKEYGITLGYGYFTKL